MKYRVNLFDNSLLPEKIILSFNQLCLTLIAITFIGIVTAVVMFFLNFQQQNLLNEQQTQQQQLLTQQQQLVHQLNQNKADSRLMAQLDLAKSRLNLKQLILNELELRNTINSQGFSPLLTDLASISMANVWLTRIQAKDQSLNLEGYSLQAQDVPLWIEALKNTHSVQGYSFAAMTINEDANKPLAFVLSSQPIARTLK